MSAPALRAIQVGFGPWGTDWAANVLPHVPEIDVVAAVDARWVESDAAVPPQFASLSEALAAVEADAVIATVGIEAHHAVAKEALLARKHVLLEKPFTVTLAEATELAELAAMQGLALLVAQNYRYWPEAVTARRLVAEGAVGDVLNARVAFRRNHNDYGPALTAPPGSPTSSVLYQIAVHHLDLVRFILGEARCIDARRWRHGNVPGRTLTAFSATLELASGALVEYSANQASLAPSTAWSAAWEIEGTAGSLLWEGNSPGVQEPTLGVLLQREHEEANAVVLDGLRRSDRQAVALEFVQCVQRGATSGLSAGENLRTMRMVSDIVSRLHDA